MIEIPQLTDEQIEREFEARSKQPTPQIDEAAMDADIEHQFELEKAKAPGQQLLAGIEKFGEGAIGFLAPAAEEVLSRMGVPGISAEERRAREELYPGTGFGAETAGFVASSFIPVVGQAKVLGKIGSKVVPVADKLGSKAVRSAIEIAAMSGSSQIAKYINQTPGQTVGNSIAHIGLAGVVGGGLSLGTSIAWRSGPGQKVYKSLSSLAKHLGWIEGVEKTAVEEMIDKSGLEVEPILKGAMETQAGKDAALKLAQTDNIAGRSFQNRLSNMKEESSEMIAQNLGTNIDQVPKQIDKHYLGTGIGTAVDNDSAPIITPAVEKFQNALKEVKDIELVPDVIERVQTEQTLKNPYLTPEFTENKTNGVASEAIDKLLSLAKQKEWTDLPKSPQMGLINEVIEALPKKNTVGGINALIEYVGGKFQKNAPDQSLNYAIGQIKQILKDVEIDAIARAGKDKGILQSGRDAYRQAFRIIDPLIDRLGMGRDQSLTGFAGRLKEMIVDDAEGVLSKLNAKNDVFILNHIKEHFPETAQAIRKYYVDTALHKAIDPNGVMNPVKIINNLKSLSPQLQEFVMGNKEANIKAIGEVFDKFKDPRFNFSNSGRAVHANTKYWPATITLMIAELMGKGHIPSVGYAALGHLFLNEGMDALKLGTLKFLGTAKSIDPGAFKVMTSYLANAVKGNQAIDRITKAVFESGKKILPEELSNMTLDSILEQLDTHLQEISTNPDKLQPVSGPISYYMPDESIGLTSTVVNVANYVDQFRPKKIKMGPLEAALEPTKEQKQNYFDILKIANQPLVAIQDMKDGTLTDDQVNHLKNMYPEMYEDLSNKLFQQMTASLTKGEEIPYRTKFGLSVFFGQPMDMDFDAQTVAANQAALSAGIQQEQQLAQAGQQRVKPSAGAIRHLKSQDRYSLEPRDNA